MPGNRAGACNKVQSVLPEPPGTGGSGGPPPLASANRIGPARAHSLYYTYKEGRALAYATRTSAQWQGLAIRGLGGGKGPGLKTRVQTSGPKARIQKLRSVQKLGFKSSGPKARVPKLGSKNPGPKARVQTPGPTTSGPKARVQKLGSKSSGPNTRVRKPGSKHPGPKPRVQKLVSESPGPKARVQKLGSNSSGANARVRTRGYQRVSVHVQHVGA